MQGNWKYYIYLYNLIWAEVIFIYLDEFLLIDTQILKR